MEPSRVTLTPLVRPEARSPSETERPSQHELVRLDPTRLGRQCFVELDQGSADVGHLEPLGAGRLVGRDDLAIGEGLCSDLLDEERVRDVADIG